VQIRNYARLFSTKQYSGFRPLPSDRFHIPWAGAIEFVYVFPAHPDCLKWSHLMPLQWNESWSLLILCFPHLVFLRPTMPLLPCVALTQCHPLSNHFMVGAIGYWFLFFSACWTGKHFLCLLSRWPVVLVVLPTTFIYVISPSSENVVDTWIVGWHQCTIITEKWKCE
jgi:hypothetical protein